MLDLLMMKIALTDDLINRLIVFVKLIFLDLSSPHMQLLDKVECEKI